MRRILGTFLATLLVVSVSAAIQAQGAKTMNASGTVSAVALDSVTVKGKAAGEEWTFMIDKDTTVVAKGASHKSLAMKADGKATVLTDFVKMGDSVTVSYHDTGTMKHAATINVTMAAAK